MRFATLAQAARYFEIPLATLNIWLLESGIEPQVVRSGTVVTTRLSPAQFEELVRRYTLGRGANGRAPSSIDRIHELLKEISQYSSEFLDEVLDIVELLSRTAGHRAYPWNHDDTASRRDRRPPKSVEDGHAVLDALDLLKSVPTLSAPQPAPHQPQNRIYIVAQTPSGRLFGSPRLSEARRHAVRLALERGWDVTLLIAWPADEETALVVVEDLLACVGGHGHLDLYLLRPGEVTEAGREFVLVPGHGAVVLNEPVDQRYVPPDSGDHNPDTLRFRHLLQETQLILARSVPTMVAGHMDAPMGISVNFLNKIAQAEAHPGPRGLVMDGVSDLLIPIRVHEERTRPIHDKGESGDRQFAKGMSQYRQTRDTEFHHRVLTDRIRDICSKGAIMRLVKDGCSSPTDALRSLGCEPLSTSQRRQVLSDMIALLANENYEMGLLEDAQAEDLHLDRAYWLVKPGHRVLMETWHANPRGARVQLNLEITDGRIADAFYDYFLTRLWDRIDPCNKRKSDVIAWLARQHASLPPDATAPA